MAMFRLPIQLVPGFFPGGKMAWYDVD